MARQRDADAMEERIAGGEHADLLAALCQHLAHLRIERARPCAAFAAGDRRDQRQMALAAEDDIGLGDAPLGLVAETRYTVLADADDGEPLEAGFLL